MREFPALSSLCSLFKGVSRPGTERLLECLGARTVNVDAGTPLFLAGDKADRFGIVVSGALRVVSYGADGRRGIIKRVGPMEVVAAAQAVSRDAFEVTVEAEEASEVLVLKSAQALSPCRKCCAPHLALMRNLMKTLAEKTLELNTKIGILSRRATAERLMAYLDDASGGKAGVEFDIPFDRQGLADFLCVERSALSSEIGRLVRAGAISARKNRFSILRRRT